jgi:hypothetical protein
MPSTSPASSCHESRLELRRAFRICDFFRLLPFGIHGNLHDAEGGIEEGERCVDAPPGVGGEGSAVEDQLVVAAHLVDEDGRQLVPRRQLGDHAAPLERLAHVPGRARGIEQHRHTRARELGHRIDVVAHRLSPDVLAHAETQRRACVAQGDGLAPLRRREVALLVEDVVGREQRLGPYGNALASRQHHGGVGEAGRPGALHRNHRAQSDRHVSRRRAQRLEFAQLRLHETVALQEIHRRIAGEDHFRQHHDVRACAGRLRRRFFHEAPVAGQVSDRGIYLCQRDSHASRIGVAARGVKPLTIPPLRRSHRGSERAGPVHDVEVALREGDGAARGLELVLDAAREIEAQRPVILLATPRPHDEVHR